MADLVIHIHHFQKDNGYRVRITAQGCTFIIDAYKMKAYPQFKPLTANYAGVRGISWR